MSSFSQVLKYLLGAKPLTVQQQDLVLDMLPSVPDPDDVLSALVQHTPAEQWTLRTARTLQRSQTATLRGDGWYGAGIARLPFTTSEWETAALAENDRHVRRELLALAPADASRAAIAALVDVTTLDIGAEKFADAKLRTEEYCWFAYDLLEHMPFHAGWVCAELLQHADPSQADYTKASAALTNCNPTVGAMDPRVPALYRVRLAAHHDAPAGVMTSVVTDLRSNRPALTALAATLTAGQHLRTAFKEMLDVPYGTGEDRAALLEFMTASDVLGVHPGVDQVEHHKELLHLERHASPAEVAVTALRKTVAVLRRPEQVRALWNRLPVEERTDEVCLAVIKSSEDMGHTVAAHLGARARQVLETDGFLEYALGRNSAATWMLAVDRPRWIREVRQDASDERLKTLLSLTDDTRAARAAIVEDLKRDYLDWPSSAVARVLQHLGPDDLDDLFTHIPAATVAIWASTGSEEAAQALWTSLEDAVRTDTPTQGSAHGSVQVDATRAAAVAALLSGPVTLYDLQVAQHV